MAVTPGRHTRLIVDTGGLQTIRNSWELERSGAKIRASKTNAVSTSQVGLWPGDAWMLETLGGGDYSRFVTEEGSALFLSLADLNAASGWSEFKRYRSPSDLPGVQVASDVVQYGLNGFIRKIAANESYDAELDADAAAFPKPTLPTSDVPMSRMLVSKRTFEPNAAFFFAFSTPFNSSTYDNLATFYWGGKTEALPQGARGGEFSLTFRGDGEALLYEFDGDEWQRRFSFQWRGDGGENEFGIHALEVRPYGRDRIAFRMNTRSVSRPEKSSDPAAPLPSAGTYRNHNRDVSAVYRNVAALTGYAAKRFATGSGVVRVDVRQDLRSLVSIAHLKPRASGTLVDLPFWCHYALTAEVEIVVRPDAYLPPGTSITPRLFHTDTDMEITADSYGRFRTVNGRQSYYVAFDFASDEDPLHTPILYGYRVEIAAGTLPVASSPVAMPLHGQVAISGPDLQPDHDTASCQVEDTRNQYSILRTRARIPAKIALYDDNGDLASILFQGEVSRATPTRKGKSGRLYPSPEASRYNLLLAGEWASLADKITISTSNFAKDPGAPVLPSTGERPPWKITDIIRYCLQQKCGYPPEMVDVPDLPIRLWLGEGGDGTDFRLRPTVGVSNYLKTLCQDYLGRALVFDPNAGTNGMWRLLPNPQPPYSNVLAAFVSGGTSPGKLVTAPGSYPAYTTFILDGTFDSYVSPPEANQVVVIGNGGRYEDIGVTQMAQRMYNPISLDPTGALINPSHPDYLRGCVEIVHVDYTLTSPEAVNWVLRRLYDRTAHGEKWARFTAPLILVVDPTDPYQARPRPLRVNDVVNVMGYLGIVRSCNPNWQISDRIQFANYEVKIVS